MPDSRYTTKAQPHGSRVRLSVLLLMLVNLAIAAKLFGVEYSAYNGSIEGTFIAISRIMAKYPGQWQWWPFWNGGLPFEDVYLPFTHWLVAAFSLLTRVSAGRAFHIVEARVLIFYGEAPHMAALALLAVAVVCFSRALTTRQVKWQLLAGGMSACVVLSNAFGIVMLPVALVCWLMAFPLRPWWRAPLTLAAIGIVAYCWISPWLSPSMIRAIRADAPTTGGDFR